MYSFLFIGGEASPQPLQRRGVNFSTLFVRRESLPTGKFCDLSIYRFYIIILYLFLLRKTASSFVVYMFFCFYNKQVMNFSPYSKGQRETQLTVSCLFLPSFGGEGGGSLPHKTPRP